LLRISFARDNSSPTDCPIDLVAEFRTSQKTRVVPMFTIRRAHLRRFAGLLRRARRGARKKVQRDDVALRVRHSLSVSHWSRRVSNVTVKALLPIDLAKFYGARDKVVTRMMRYCSQGFHKRVVTTTHRSLLGHTISDGGTNPQQ